MNPETMYLYTENFRTKGFDLYAFENDSEWRLVKEPEGELSDLGKIENQSEFADGIAADGKTHSGNKWITFRIVIDQNAPSGRGRLVWGVVPKGVLDQRGVDFAMSAIRKFLGKLSLSAQEERLNALHSKLQQIWHNENTWQTAVGAAALTFGAVCVTIGLSKLKEALKAYCRQRENMPSQLETNVEKETKK